MVRLSKEVRLAKALQLLIAVADVRDSEVTVEDKSMCATHLALIQCNAFRC